MSWKQSLPRAMSGSMGMQKPFSGVVSVAPVTTKRSTDAGIWSAIHDHVGIRGHAATGVGAVGKAILI